MLVDTSVWIDHFRRGNETLAERLAAADVWVHPFVMGELACGRLTRRREILALLQALPQAPLIEHREVLAFVGTLQGADQCLPREFPGGRDQRRPLRAGDDPQRHVPGKPSGDVRVDSDGRGKAKEIQKMIAAPLTLSGGEVIGVVEVSRKGKSPEEAGSNFTPAELTELTQIGAAVAPWIQRLTPPDF